MQNYLSKIVVVILAVLLLYIHPTIRIAQNYDDKTQIYVMNKVTRFVDSARNGGYIDINMMMTLNKQLAATGNVYKIKITHEHKSFYPVYDDAGEFTGKSQMTYKDTFEDVILDEIYNGDGEYTMTEGDQLSVSVTTSAPTFAQKIYSMVTNTMKEGPAINVCYGGRVRDDLH